MGAFALAFCLAASYTNQRDIRSPLASFFALAALALRSASLSDMVGWTRTELETLRTLKHGFVWQCGTSTLPWNTRDEFQSRAVPVLHAE